MDVPLETNKSYTIQSGDVLRLNVKDSFACPYQSLTSTKFIITLSNLKLLFGNIKTNYDYGTNYANGFKNKVDSFISEKATDFYRLTTNYTTYSGDNLSFNVGNNNFYTNDLNYEIGDNFSLTLYNNSCFAFKTASNFSTYDISFYDEIYYVNKPFDLQADKCYIISYLNGVVVWNEMQEYQSN